MDYSSNRSRCCKVAGIILTVIYTVLCLAYTLVIRLYVKTFYISAHVASMGFIQTLILALHLCTTRSCMRKALICGRGHCSDWFLCILAAIYFLLNLGCAVAYTVLFFLTINYSFDIMAAMVTAWLTTAFMLYFFVTKVSSACKKRRKWECETDIATVGVENEMFPVYTIGTYKSGSINPLVTEKSGSKKNGCCAKCMMGICKCVYSFLYLLFHFILIIFVFFSAYFPSSVLYDYTHYRDSSDMYTVKVGDHNPLALFLKCKGDGNETLLIENGFSGLAMVNWPFLVKELSPKYTVCVHDRRGIGWSESFEYDSLANIMGAQYTVNNIEFTKALVEKAKSKLRVPFYYAGHSYGGQHVAYMAFKYPQLVKGLIFLDSSRFGGIAPSDIMEIVANFRATGLLHFVVAHAKLINLAAIEEVKRLVDLSEIPTSLFDMVLASMISGEYFVTYNREWEHISQKSFKEVSEAIGSKQIIKPALVIDAGSGSSSNWFPADSFPLFNQTTNYKTVPGASHSGLIFTEQYAPITSKLIDDFISTNELNQ